MADVYLACTQGPRGFQKLLVVKLARFTGDPVFATMFLEEARIAAQLEHPNIVQTYEIAEHGSRHYIVMEYLDGGNLARLRQRSAKTGGVPLRVSLTILLHTLEGLEYAHEARTLDGRELNVVHRDLSPANIMVTAQGVVKILDFGIAKATDSYSFTQTGKFSGKLGYMPPEQMRGDPVDARADLFAFGVILAESALNGKLWGNATGPEIASKLAGNQIPTLDRGKPIDPQLRAICLRALAPDREERYWSAADLKVDLVKFLGSLGGPVAQRELAQFVRTTMGNDRAELQAVIDAQLQNLGSPDKIGSPTWSINVPVAEPPRIEDVPSQPPSPEIATRATGFEDNEPPQIIISEPAPVARLMPARAMSRKVRTLGGALLVASSATVVMLAWPSNRPAPAPAPAVPPVIVAPALPAPPVATTVRLGIVASPSDARLVLDGKALGTNPFVGAFERDTQVHELVISAPGHQSLTRTFTLDRDFNLQLNLMPDPVRVPAPVPPPVAVPPPAPPPQPSVAGKRTRPAPVKATAVAPAAPPAVETKETKAEPAKPPPSAPRRPIDTDVLPTPSNKRSLDSNVLEDESAKSKRTIERDPWQK
jgi:serine/threonine-protein kinase